MSVDFEARAPNASVSDGFLIALPAEVIEHLVEAVAARVLARLGGQRDGRTWFDVEGAADYLAMPVERLRKLIGRRAIPFHQEAPGHRISPNRSDLDGCGWRPLVTPREEARRR